MQAPRLPPIVKVQNAGFGLGKGETRLAMESIREQTRSLVESSDRLTCFNSLETSATTSRRGHQKMLVSVWIQAPHLVGLIQIVCPPENAFQPIRDRAYELKVCTISSWLLSLVSPIPYPNFRFQSQLLPCKAHYSDLATGKLFGHYVRHRQSNECCCMHP